MPRHRSSDSLYFERMPDTWKSFLRRLAPPIAVDVLLRRPPSLRFSGNYPSWKEAREASAGYDGQTIHDVVLAGARAVRDGRAAFERDGVTFAVPEFVWPVAAALLGEAAKAKGRLRVLDFGGSLGSFYFQHRRLFRGLDVRWAIVEQPAFVETGEREFADECLSFHTNIRQASDAVAPSVVLFSSVLNYLEHPHDVIDEVVRGGFGAVIIDRTALALDQQDRLTVQQSPQHVYAASYPAWLFKRSGLLGHFAADYEMVAEFQCAETGVAGAQFAGFYFARRGP